MILFAGTCVENITFTDSFPPTYNLDVSQTLDMMVLQPVIHVKNMRGQKSKVFY